jgi:Holliday junction resolvase-like predicted endonuclease
MVNYRKQREMKKSAVEWLAEKYNYIDWMRRRDEISPATADEWRFKFLNEAKEMEKEQIICSCN